MSLLNFEHWNRLMKAFKNISICLVLIISQLGLVASAEAGAAEAALAAGTEAIILITNALKSK